MKKWIVASYADTFKRYSVKYGVSLIEAIQDRDEPLRAHEIGKILQALGVEPSEANIKQCRPSSEESVEEYESFMNE